MTIDQLLTMNFEKAEQEFGEALTEEVAACNSAEALQQLQELIKLRLAELAIAV